MHRLAVSTDRLGSVRAGKYLAFHLDGADYAIQVLRVREIMGMREVTSVPRTPHFVRGVLKLRGRVIPVIDLRLKVGLPAQEYTEQTCIIVVQVPAEGASAQMGIIVDAVSEVLTLADEEIEDAPDVGAGVQLPYVLGIARTKGKVKTLLSIETVLNTQDVGGLRLLHT